MKGELYLRVQLGLPHSDGAAILERHLGERRAWAYTHQMWDWFASKHPGGELTGLDAAYLIARGAGWEGDPDKFCSAQVLAGYLAVIPEGFRVRGWEKWAGFYFTVKAKERTKKAKQREPVPAVSPSESPGCPRDVPGTEQEKRASESDCPGDPSPISSIKYSVGVQGEGRRVPRTRLVSPYPEGEDPCPVTTAVLAALHERGIDAAGPSAKSAGRVETALSVVGVEAAVERLAVILADPEAKRPLTYHVDALRAPKPKRAVGDLGCEAHPWYTRMTPEDVRAYVNERTLIDPDGDGAPIGVIGPERQFAELNDKWRAIVDAREEVTA